MSGLGFKLTAVLVQIDFLLAELDGLPPVKSDRLHPKRVLVKINRCVNIRNCQDEMIEVVDNECHVLYINAL